MTTISSYATRIDHAEKAYRENLASLNDLAAAKDNQKSLAYEIDRTNSQAVELKGKPRDAADFESLKGSFTVFLQEQLNKYETAHKAVVSGQKAIATVQNTLASCTAFKPSALELQAIKDHLTGLGFVATSYEQRQAAADQKIAGFNAVEMTGNLQGAIDRVKAQVPLLATALDKAYLVKKEVEGKADWMDAWLPASPLNPYAYLEAALAEKNTPKIAVAAAAAVISPAEDLKVTEMAAASN